MTSISKSKFLSGIQCEKKIYLDVHNSALKAEPDAGLQARFMAGHQVGLLAQQCYPGGKNATEDINGNWNLAIRRTQDWLKNHVTPIYEASFAFAGGFSAIDILHRQDNEWHLIEVKSSFEVKAHYLHDVAYQYYVMTESGMKPDKVFLMLIDPCFIKEGPISSAAFFKQVDVTAEVQEAQKQISIFHAEFSKVLNSENAPIREIGAHCRKPYPCPYINHCFAHLPENHVFRLSNARGKSEQLYNMGITSLSDIPDEFPLSRKQILQVRGIKYAEAYSDPIELDQFLEGIQEPVHFFDFETIDPLIPILDGTTPGQKLPFQYSCHVSNLDGSIIAHREFLADPAAFRRGSTENPRKNLILQLKEDIASAGSVLVYHAPFEKERLQELARDFPEDKIFLESIISRLVDLLTPFSKGWFYKPEMNGSASMKSVLPAINPEYSYNDLAIGDGITASETFKKLVDETYLGDEEEARKDLHYYCGLDTEGMVVIYRALKEHVNTHLARFKDKLGQVNRENGHEGNR